MVDIVTRVNNVVNGFVWGPFGLALLLCTGLWLSVRTGFFQFRRMGYWQRTCWASTTAARTKKASGTAARCII